MVIKGLTVPQKLDLVVASSCSVKSWYFVYAFSFVFPGRGGSACPSPFYFAHWPQGDLQRAGKNSVYLQQHAECRAADVRCLISSQHCHPR